MFERSEAFFDLD